MNANITSFLFTCCIGLQTLFAQSGAYPPWTGSSEGLSKAESEKEQRWGEWNTATTPTSPAAAFTAVKGVFSNLGVDAIPTVWGRVAAAGRMDLPGIMIQQDAWLPLYMGFHFPSESHDSNVRCRVYHKYWNMAVRALPEQIFGLMAADALRAEIRTVDLVRLSGSLGYQVERKDGELEMVGWPRKADWQALYMSANPCYRIIAFEYYDKVSLTPAELLAVYEDGLFHACSYVEMRILAGIQKHSDYRPEVKTLLQRYLDSSPLLDDGTQVRNYENVRMPFPSVRAGVEVILDAINGE